MVLWVDVEISLTDTAMILAAIEALEIERKQLVKQERLTRAQRHRLGELQDFADWVETENMTLQRVYGRLLEQYARLPTLPESEFDPWRLPALEVAMEIVEKLLDREVDSG